EVAGAKRATTDAGTRVLLIAQWPGVISPKTVNNDLIDFSDFLPTICEATGIKIPESLQLDGKSFLPQLQGESGQPRKWIYCWFARNPSIHEPKIFVRNQRYKLYASGEFYEVPKDWDEQNPVKIEDLDEDTEQTYQMFKKVLNHYSTKRLECIPEKTETNE
ncbi:MAG: arylsulfatase, partial [Bacteroidetes bacterium]